MKHMPGSMSVIVLIILSSLALTILGCWQMLSARYQLMQRSITAEQEERLCAGMAEIGIILVRQQSEVSDEHEQTFEYRIPAPSCFAAYYGMVSYTVGKPMVPLQVTLFCQGQIRRALRLVLAYDREQKLMQVLEWVLL